MTILPPQAEYCDCIHDFILTILDKKPDQTYTDLCSDNQQERCQLSECSIVKNFRIPPREKATDDDNDGLFSTHPMPSYVHRHPSQTNDKHDQSELPHSHIQVIIEFNGCMCISLSVSFFFSLQGLSNISIESE